MTNDFNDYFSNIGLKLSENIKASSDNNIYHTMPPTNTNSLFLSPISIFEIERIINETKVKYSNDTYNLNMSVIKEIRVEITSILFHLFNRSLSEGIFPIALKKLNNSII